jgi:ABC-type Mn2+/Zn2+ transport system ATPase subunit
MKARVALARALDHQARLLLLDEALASLDIGWRLHLHHELISLRERLQLTILDLTRLGGSDADGDRSSCFPARFGCGRAPADREPGDRLRRMEELIMIDHPASARES